MTENPYSPPAVESKSDRSADPMVGDFTKRMKTHELMYLGFVFLGPLLADDRSIRQNSGVNWILLGLSVVIFALHCYALLTMRGAVRTSIIVINALLILGAWLGKMPALVWANLVLHVFAVPGTFFQLSQERQRAQELLQAEDPLPTIEKEIAEKGENELRLQLLGISYGQKERYAEALRVMLRCLKLNPYNSATHANVVWLMSEVGHHQEAEEAFQRILDQPLDKVLRLQVETNYCRLLTRLGRSEEARERLDKTEQTLAANVKISNEHRQILTGSIEKARTALNQNSKGTPEQHDTVI